MCIRDRYAVMKARSISDWVSMCALVHPLHNELRMKLQIGESDLMGTASEELPSLFSNMASCVIYLTFSSFSIQALLMNLITYQFSIPQVLLFCDTLNEFL